MVAWVVIYRRYHRQACPLLRLLSAPSFPLRHLFPLLPTPYALLLHNGNSSTPLQSIFYGLFLSPRGGVPPSMFRRSSISACFRAIPFPITLLRTLLHFPRTQ